MEHYINVVRDLVLIEGMGRGGGRLSLVTGLAISWLVSLIHCNAVRLESTKS